MTSTSIENYRIINDHYSCFQSFKILNFENIIRKYSLKNHKHSFYLIRIVDHSMQLAEPTDSWRICCIQFNPSLVEAIAGEPSRIP